MLPDYDPLAAFGTAYSVGPERASSQAPRPRRAFRVQKTDFEEALEKAGFDLSPPKEEPLVRPYQPPSQEGASDSEADDASRVAEPELGPWRKKVGRAARDGTGITVPATIMYHLDTSRGQVSSVSVVWGTPEGTAMTSGVQEAFDIFVRETGFSHPEFVARLGPRCVVRCPAVEGGSSTSAASSATDAS